MARVERKYLREKKYLFVDGYNILHQWDIFQGMLEGELEEARELLISKMIEFAHLNGVELILVFDAYKQKGADETVILRDGIEIVYTKERMTADRYIEGELARMGRVKDVIVATSDQIEQQLILALGGSRLSAREFEIIVMNMDSRVQKNVRNLNVKGKKITHGLSEEAMDSLKNMRNQL